MRFFTSSKHCWPWIPLTAWSGCICFDRPFKSDRHDTDDVTPLWSTAVPSRIQATQPHPPLQSLSVAWLRKLLHLQLLSAPNKPICLTWTGCEWSFVALFSLWEKSQVEKASLNIWQRGKGECEQDLGTRTFPERSSLRQERKSPKYVAFRGTQVSVVGPKPREDEGSLQEVWGILWNWQFHGHFSPPNKVDFRADLDVVSLKMLTGVSAPGSVACGLCHNVTSGKDSCLGSQ